MGQKMKNAPVYFTLAQVRFNQIPSLDSFLPLITEQLRLAGYPDIKEGNALASFSFSLGDEKAPPQVSQSVTKRHTATNVAGTCGFILEPGALTLQTTEYDVFPAFSAELLKGLEIIHSSVTGGISLTERIGLRYLDAVYPDDHEVAGLSAYLVPEVLGLSAKIQGALVHSYSETVIHLGDNTVITRAIIQDGPVGFPPDLNPIGMLTMSPRFTQRNGRHAILDTDASYSGREPFDLAVLSERLQSLRESVGEAFEATVTPYAKKAWE